MPFRQVFRSRWGVATTAVAVFAVGGGVVFLPGGVNPDTSAPACFLTAPLPSGSTVAGSAVAVSATCGDNVGVTGVQFQLNGANLGAEVTSAPYSTVWNQTLSGPGSYTLTAISRDAAGHTHTSSPVTAVGSGKTVTLNVDANFVPDTKGGTIKFSGLSTTPGDLVSGANTITNVITTGVHPQDFVSGAGIPANTHIVSVDSSSQETMSANATATVTATPLTYTGLLLGGALFNCHTAVASYAPSDPNAVIVGSGLPLKVNIVFQQGYLVNISNGAAISNGCTGDASSSTTDLSINMPNSDGRTTGAQWDAVKVQGGSNVQITGAFNCGLPGPGAHQDGIQALGSDGVTFSDFTVGDWVHQHATCRGDGGGGPYINCNQVPPNSGTCPTFPSNITFTRGKVIVCNKGFNIGVGGSTSVTGTVSNNIYRTGAPTDYAPGGPCDPAITGANPPGTPITSSAADDGTGHAVGAPNVIVSGNIGETWCASTCAWVGFNPANN